MTVDGRRVSWMSLVLSGVTGCDANAAIKPSAIYCSIFPIKEFIVR
jgi:hypothetical protein